MFNSLDINLIRKVRGNQYKAIAANRSMLPEMSGVYIWRYWPSLSDTSYEGMMKAIQAYQENFPASIEKVSGKWTAVELQRNYYHSDINTEFLGIPASSVKYSALLDSLRESAEARKALAHALEMIFLSAPPLYVGKAENISVRLGEHIDKKTGFSKRLEASGMNMKYVYISYFLDDVSCDGNSFSSTLEEILQRVSFPPLVKRFG